MIDSTQYRSLQIAIAYLAFAWVPTWVGCSGADDRPNPEAVEQARARAQSQIEEGYEFKRTGENGQALDHLVKACALLEKNLGSSAPELASCLDDLASVQVRLGDYEKARQLYYRALRIAAAAESADPLLVSGIRYRIGRIGRFERLGIRCAEPASPPTEPVLPYFPDTTQMQRALGNLDLDFSSCAQGPPRPVTLKVTVTGDGVPVMVETRGTDAGTRLGRCMEDRVLQAIPGAPLPRFRACFRAFTYPFVVGELSQPKASEQKP